MNLESSIMKSKSYLKKHLPDILSVAASVGVVATSVSTAKATVKAVRLVDYIEAGKDEFDEPESKLQIFEDTYKFYIPTVFAGATTIACILGSNALNKKAQASLISAMALVHKYNNEYREKVKELYGEDADEKVKKKIAEEAYKEKPLEKYDDTVLFYDQFSRRYFNSTRETVQAAEYHLNRNFALRGEATINEFYDFLGIDKIDGGEYLGWSLEAGDMFYGYSFIDFDHEKITMDDGLECMVISMPFAPTSDYDTIE